MALFRRCRLALWLCAAVLCASQPWAKQDPSQWTAADVQKILNDSPWAQQAMAAFGKPLEPDDMPVTPPPGAEGGASPYAGRGVSDGRWDGGIARNTGVGDVPQLPVTVRWDSALPMREALARANQTSPLVTIRSEKDYVLTVIGLVPATTAPGTDRPADDPAQIQAFLANSRLRAHGRSFAPEDAAIDRATGAVHLLFPRADAISAADKEVFFVTRFGSVSVQKKFRLKDMFYKGRLEL